MISNSFASTYFPMGRNSISDRDEHAAEEMLVKRQRGPHLKEVGEVPPAEIVDMLESSFDEVNVTLHAAEKARDRFGHLEFGFFTHLFREACVRMHRKRKKCGDRHLFRKAISFARRGETGIVVCKSVCTISVSGMKFCFVKDPSCDQRGKNGKRKSITLMTVCI